MLSSNELSNKRMNLTVRDPGGPAAPAIFIKARPAGYPPGGLKGTTQHLGDDLTELLRRRRDVAETKVP